MRHGDGAVRVGFIDLAHELHRQALQGVQGADAGIVDQHVDRPGFFHDPADAVRVGDVERQDAQMVGPRQHILTRGAHGGDDLPIALEEMTGGIQAEAGRTSGDEDGFHGTSDGLFGVPEP